MVQIVSVAVLFFSYSSHERQVCSIDVFLNLMVSWWDGRLFCKTVNCAKNSVLFLKGGQVVATKLECQVAMLAARQVQIHFLSVCFDGERTSKSYMQEISFVCFLDVQMLRSLKLRVCNWPWLCLEEFRREIAFSITVKPCCQSFQLFPERRNLCVCLPGVNFICFLDLTMICKRYLLPTHHKPLPNEKWSCTA